MTKQRIKQLLPTETFHIDLVYDDVSLYESSHTYELKKRRKIRSPRCDRSHVDIGRITITDLVKNYLVQPIVPLHSEELKN